MNSRPEPMHHSSSREMEYWWEEMRLMGTTSAKVGAVMMVMGDGYGQRAVAKVITRARVYTRKSDSIALVI